jgi:hypothetical protein
MSGHGSIHGLVIGAALAAWMAITPTAADTPPKHIRGTIEALHDHVITVKKAGGATNDIMLANDAKVFTVSPADISAIGTGKFVGITSVEKGGKRVAVEVHVFDESLRGLGEGHDPWDLESEPNMMTNANIAQVEAVGGDRMLTLAYKDGTQRIDVPPDAVVVAFTAGSPNQIKPGAKVFVIAREQPEGKLAAGAIVVGKEGMKPPM